MLTAWKRCLVMFPVLYVVHMYSLRPVGAGTPASKGQQRHENPR